MRDQLAFPGMEEAHLTAGEIKKLVRLRLDNFPWRQKVRDLKRKQSRRRREAANRPTQETI